MTIENQSIINLFIPSAGRWHKHEKKTAFLLLSAYFPLQSARRDDALTPPSAMTRWGGCGGVLPVILIPAVSAAARLPCGIWCNCATNHHAPRDGNISRYCFVHFNEKKKDQNPLSCKLRAVKKSSFKPLAAAAPPAELAALAVCSSSGSGDWRRRVPGKPCRRLGSRRGASFP